MNVIKLSAFSKGQTGGNPAGVVIANTLPSDHEMLAIAADVGFSETAFASYDEGDPSALRVRYFSPETEVPFCGHATIALGAALTEHFGSGTYTLTLNDATISVEGDKQNDQITAALQSPPTHSKALTDEEKQALLDLFGYRSDDLDRSIPSALIHAGADHYVLALKSRKALSDMSYDMEEGKAFMRQRGLVTIMLVHREQDQLFHVRNAFRVGRCL